MLLLFALSTEHRAAGFVTHDTHHFEGATYHIYTAPKNQDFAVQNLGDGGFLNWCPLGSCWVCWGRVIHFHSSWNNGMGKKYDTRPESEYPHLNWLKDSAWHIH
jgi:hypothetical protein